MVEIVCGSTAVVTNKMAAVITAIAMTIVRAELLISPICAAFRPKVKIIQCTPKACYLIHF